MANETLLVIRDCQVLVLHDMGWEGQSALSPQAERAG